MKNIDSMEAIDCCSWEEKTKKDSVYFFLKIHLNVLNTSRTIEIVHCKVYYWILMVSKWFLLDFTWYINLFNMAASLLCNRAIAFFIVKDCNPVLLSIIRCIFRRKRCWINKMPSNASQILKYACLIYLKIGNTDFKIVGQ